MKKIILIFLFIGNSFYVFSNNLISDVSFNEFIYSHIKNNELYISGNINDFKEFIESPENDCYIKFIFCSKDVKKVNLNIKAFKAVHTLWGSYILDIDGSLYAFDQIRPFSPSIYFEKKPKKRNNIKLLNKVKFVKSNGHLIIAVTDTWEMYYVGNHKNTEYHEPHKYMKLKFEVKDLTVTDNHIYIADKNNIIYIIDLIDGKPKKYKKLSDFNKFIKTDIDNGILYINQANKIICSKCGHYFTKTMNTIKKYQSNDNKDNELIEAFVHNDDLGLVFNSKLIFKTKNNVYYRSYEF